MPCVLGVSGKEMMLNAVEVPFDDERSVADVVATEHERVEGLTEQDTAKTNHYRWNCKSSSENEIFWNTDNLSTGGILCNSLDSHAGTGIV